MAVIRVLNRIDEGYKNIPVDILSKVNGPRSNLCGSSRCLRVVNAVHFVQVVYMKNSEGFFALNSPISSILYRCFLLFLNFTLFVGLYLLV